MSSQNYAYDDGGEMSADSILSEKFDENSDKNEGVCSIPLSDVSGSVDVNVSEIKNAAIALLARREHSRHELKTKLCGKYSDVQDVERQLDSLAHVGIQSDERFVESYVNVKKKQGKGPNYIKRELKRRGVSDFLIASYVYEGDDAWLDLANVVYEKKFGRSPIKDNKEKARRIRFMVSRGFTPASVFPTLNDYSELP